MTAAFPSEISNYNINPNFSHSSSKKYSLNNENNIKSCRICLSEDNEKSNPLISPCHCKGTMKWIHLICLKQCIKNKIESIEDEVTQIFSWQNLDCELCKTSFISENCKLRSISNLFQPEKKIKSFVSFLSLQHDISNKFFLFLLNLDSKEEINLV